MKGQGVPGRCQSRFRGGRKALRQDYFTFKKQVADAISRGRRQAVCDVAQGFKGSADEGNEPKEEEILLAKSVLFVSQVRIFTKSDWLVFPLARPSLKSAIFLEQRKKPSCVHRHGPYGSKG